ncbi:VRR-NUC domain-containing protein [Rhizobium lentis]|uniref:VRR-NUC domain-containing protein n=1 Tax=Rhizobium lentis TaxID=1138194 RepID=UPI002180CFDE|nr:VRR-NUC domain-containing protein [Rhizobium lentis]
MVRKVEVRPGDVVIRQARPFHAGFEGLSDLGGWAPVEITPDMVGTTLPIYAQVEVKAGSGLTAEQRKWIDAVRKVGGRAGVARNEEDLKKILFGNV